MKSCAVRVRPPAARSIELRQLTRACGLRITGTNAGEGGAPSAGARLTTPVIRKMNLIAQDLNKLQPLARADLTKYVASKVDEMLAERHLERIIGRMIDINYDLITESGQPPPKHYYESCIQVGRLNFLPPDLGGQIAIYAGLRNRLVQQYNEIDSTKVYEGLRAAVREIPQYLAHLHTVPPAGSRQLTHFPLRDSHRSGYRRASISESFLCSQTPASISSPVGNRTRYGRPVMDERLAISSMNSSAVRIRSPA